MLATVRKPARVLLGIGLIVEGMFIMTAGAIMPYYTMDSTGGSILSRYMSDSFAAGAGLFVIGACVMFSGLILVEKSPRWKFLLIFVPTMLLMMWRGGILLSPYAWKPLVLLPFAAWFGG